MRQGVGPGSTPRGVQPILSPEETTPHSNRGTNLKAQEPPSSRLRLTRKKCPRGRGISVRIQKSCNRPLHVANHAGSENSTPPDSSGVFVYTHGAE